MSLPNDSVLVTPGSGATVATQLVSSKEYQVMMRADIDGHIIGSKPVYIASIPWQVHVGVANTVHWDLFNADAALIVRVSSILQQPDFVTAVSGIAFAWLLERSTSVGTGGTVITPWLPDTSQAALDADITIRSKPTGGAAASTDLWNYQIHSDEVNAATVQLGSQGGLELVPKPLRSLAEGGNNMGIVLRQNQGLRCVQVTSSTAGNTGWLISFTVE